MGEYLLSSDANFFEFIIRIFNNKYFNLYLKFFLRSQNEISRYENLTSKQQDRYKYFKNTSLFGNMEAKQVRKILKSNLTRYDKMISKKDMDQIMLILGTVSKIFISDIVKKGLIANRRCDKGNLLPIHILQAYNSLVEKWPLTP